MIKNSILFLTIIFFSLTAKSQSTVDTVWTKVFGGSSIEGVTAEESVTNKTKSTIAVDSEDNIFIATSTISTDGDVGKNYGDIDAWIIKLNKNGDTLWTKVLGGSFFDSVLDLVPDGKGGCVAVGMTYSEDGVFALTGHHGTTEFEDGFVAMLDKDGKISFIKQFGSSTYTATTQSGSEFTSGGHDGLNAITATSDGNYMAVGYSNSIDNDLGPMDESQYWTGWFLKFDANGKKISSKKISHNFADNSKVQMSIFDVEQADDGNFVGYGEAVEGFTTYFWVVKTDGIDNIQKSWSQIYTSNYFQLPNTITKNKTGNFVCTGWVFGSDGDVYCDMHGGLDIWVFEVDDSDGSINNQRAVGSEGADMPKEIKLLKNGNFFMTGVTSRAPEDPYRGYGDNDFWLIELDSDLDTLATYNFGGSGMDIAHSVAVSNKENAVYFVGITNSADNYVSKNKGETDLYVGKLAFDPTLSVEENLAGSENIKCIPTDETGIFNIINASGKSITGYDICGRKIFSTTLKSDIEQIDLKNEPKGVYLLRFDNTNLTSIKVIR